MSLSAQSIKWLTAATEGQTGGNIFSIANDNQGNVYAVEYGTVACFNKSGEFQWMYTQGWRNITAISADNENNLWIAESQSDKYVDTKLVKLSQNGTVEQLRTYNDTIINEIVFGADNDMFLSYAALDTSTYQGYPRYKLCLEKRDSMGKIKWTTVVSTFANNTPQILDISLDETGAVYFGICLNFGEPCGATDYPGYFSISTDSTFYFGGPLLLNYIAKINPQGSFSWVKNMNSDGALVSTYSREGKSYYISYNFKIVYQNIVKGLDSSGNPISLLQFLLADSVEMSPRSLALDKSGNYYILSTIGFYGKLSMLTKFDPKGNRVWKHYFRNVGLTGISFNDYTGELCFGGNFTGGYQADDSPYINVVNSGSNLIGVIAGDSRLEAFSNNAISLFPNPTSSQLTIKYMTSAAASCTISISDMQGRTLLNATQLPLVAGENSIPVYVGQYAPGVYILTLQSNNDMRRVRFVKE